jgi:hypothetical protein
MFALDETIGLMSMGMAPLTSSSPWLAGLAVAVTMVLCFVASNHLQRMLHDWLVRRVEILHSVHRRRSMSLHSRLEGIRGGYETTE